MGAMSPQGRMTEKGHLSRELSEEKPQGLREEAEWAEAKRYQLLEVGTACIIFGRLKEWSGNPELNKQRRD